MEQLAISSMKRPHPLWLSLSGWLQSCCMAKPTSRTTRRPTAPCCTNRPSSIGIAAATTRPGASWASRSSRSSPPPPCRNSLGAWKIGKQTWGPLQRPLLQIWTTFCQTSCQIRPPTRAAASQVKPPLYFSSRIAPNSLNLHCSPGLTACSICYPGW